MKTARFSAAQVKHCLAAHVYMCERGHLKQAQGGTPVSGLCRELGMSSASFYKWRAKFVGMPSRAFAQQNPAG